MRVCIIIPLLLLFYIYSSQARSRFRQRNLARKKEVFTIDASQRVARFRNRSLARKKDVFTIKASQRVARIAKQYQPRVNRRARCRKKKTESSRSKPLDIPFFYTDKKRRHGKKRNDVFYYGDTKSLKPAYQSEIFWKK